MPDKDIDISQSLTEMVETNNQPALQAATTAAATQVGLQNARLFTQQGMFSRRIVEVMGLAGLDEDLRNYREAGMEDAAARLQQGRARCLTKCMTLLNAKSPCVPKMPVACCARKR